MGNALNIIKDSGQKPSDSHYSTVLCYINYTSSAHFISTIILLSMTNYRNQVALFLFNLHTSFFATSAGKLQTPILTRP
jgi:hypothetical protein